MPDTAVQSPGSPTLTQFAQQHGGIIGDPSPLPYDPQVYAPGDLDNATGVVPDPYYEYHFADGSTLTMRASGQIAPNGVKLGPARTTATKSPEQAAADLAETQARTALAQAQAAKAGQPTPPAKTPDQIAADLAQTQAATARDQAATTNMETPAERAQRAAQQEAAATQRTAMSNQAAMDRVWAESNARINEARQHLKDQMDSGQILPKDVELQLSNMYATELERVKQQIAQENASYQAQLEQGNKAYDYQLNGPRQELQAKTDAAEKAAKPGFDAATNIMGMLQKAAAAGVPWQDAFTQAYTDTFNNAAGTYNQTFAKGLQPVTPPTAPTLPPPPSLAQAPTPTTAATNTTSAPVPVDTSAASAPAPTDSAAQAPAPDEAPTPKPDDEEDQ